jgi:hypothetical protein
MKIQTVFRLGALAAIVTALGILVGDTIYFFGAAKTLFFAWYYIIVTVFEVFAIFALYAVQAKHGDIFTFVGFVLLIIGLLFFLINSAGRMGLRTGLVTQEQLEQTQQITSWIVLAAIANWSFILGTILFGFGTFRTAIFPRWAGMIFLLAGVAFVFSAMDLFEYIFAILSFAAWGWMGWALWSSPSAPYDEVRDTITPSVVAG